MLLINHFVGDVLSRLLRTHGLVRVGFEPAVGRRGRRVIGTQVTALAWHVLVMSVHVLAG